MGHKHRERDKEPSQMRDGFVFLAGHVALDFPATMVARLKPSPRDLLSSPSDLGRWLIAAEMADTMAEVTQADLTFAKGLRESIYSLALARIHREVLPDAARRELNQFAIETAAVPQLDKDGLFHLSGSARALLSRTSTFSRSGRRACGSSWPRASRSAWRVCRTGFRR